MNAERLQQIETLYNDTLELEPPEREAFLDRACGSDLELRQEVASLLVSNRAETCLDKDAVHFVAESIANGEVSGTDARLPAGTKIANYELLCLLGRGGMGEVYRARDTKLGRDVAIKALSRELLPYKELLIRFENEARLASALNHPNIITIYGVEEDEERSYIIMEFVDGRTLSEVLASGPMPIRKAVEVSRQIAEGLARAHEARIVHRDLKPANIMLTRDGLVKILDFGVSKVVPQIDRPVDQWTTLSPLTSISVLGRLLGTVPYMSPEQARGESVDFRSDQFSLGSMLYEMVTGKRAFNGPTEVQTLASILEDQPESASALNPQVPRALESIIGRCLAKRQEDRFASTAELAQELQLLQTQLPDNTRSGQYLPTASKRRRWKIPVAAVVIAIILAGSAVFVGSWSKYRPAFQTLFLPAEKQIAVLPFVNVGNDPTSQAFCDGLVETLTSKLSQLEQFQRVLRVVPASEIRREEILSVRQARQLFGVALAITGSVQRGEDRVRLTINLVDAQTLRQISARAVDAESRDLTTLQDGVVIQVAELVGIPLPLEAKQVLSSGRTATPGAYAFYLQGRGYLQRYEDRQNIETAIDLFKRAVEQDPKYALAYAGLGEAYWRKYDQTKEAKWADEARKSYDTAIQLGGKQAPVYVTLAMIYRGTGRYTEAVQQLQQALEIDPVNAAAYQELGNLYQAMGKRQEAEATFKKAIEIRPNYWAAYNDLGAFYYRSSRYADAAAQFHRVIELTPDNARGYSSLGAMDLLLKRYDESKAMLEKSVAIKPNQAAYTNLGNLYFYQDQYSQAAAYFERAVQMNGRDSLLWHNLASAYQWSSQREKARAAFERTAELAEEQRRVNPNRPNVLMDLADCYSMLDQPERSRGLLEQALKLAPNDVPIMFNAGVVYEQLGNRDRALQWIGKAIRGGYSRDLIDKAPSLADLRTDPRFRALQ
jgi:serine/threonine protein kinase/Tfp pilus assembly protein PilF